MRILLLALGLIAVSAMQHAASAAPRSVRPGVKAECLRLTAAQDFGKRYLQRRRFIQDCFIDPEFNAPDQL